MPSRGGGAGAGAEGGGREILIDAFSHPKHETNFLKLQIQGAGKA